MKKKKNQITTEEFFYDLSEVLSFILPSDDEKEKILKKIENNESLNDFENFKVNNYLMFNYVLGVKDKKI